MDFSVVLIGAGNMGGAMLKGALQSGLKPEQVAVVDPSPNEHMASFLAGNGIGIHQSTDGVKAPDVLLIAIKPQLMETVLPGLVSLLGENTVVVSVAAGTTLETLRTSLSHAQIVRVMPNTPSLVLRGMSVGCPTDEVAPAQKEKVDALLRSIGEVEWVFDEKLIDAVTAVSGSGPAYVFHLAECMAAAGEKAGLPEELSLKLALETVAGAGELMRQSSDHPTVLRQNVTSPNGTTAAALGILMDDRTGMPPLLEKAITAAKKRSEELS